MSFEPLTQAQLKERLSYDPETGVFIWLNGQMAGKVAGSIKNRGYCMIFLNNKLRSAHRIAWLYCYGAFPSGDLDHTNGIKTDNRISNLRVCSASENMCNVLKYTNNTSGFKGVVLAPNNRWHARIGVSGKTRHIGAFASAELASAAYQAKARELHGEFYRGAD